MNFDLRINGRIARVEADPSEPLLYVLRDRLGLNGAKYGCGLGQCGACAVLIGDVAIYSCLTPVVSIRDREVTTVEGLGSVDSPGRVQAAFAAEQAAQCGYCIAGMIIKTEALLRSRSRPGEKEIRAALASNLCRCGTHMRILRAARRAAEVAQ